MAESSSDDKTAVAGADDRDEAILAELLKRYDEGCRGLEEIVAEAETDMRYVSGKTWETADLTARQGRPSIELDQLNQYINQLVNEVRINKRAVKLTPEGNGANDKTSELRANRIRQIEYESHAQEAYTTLFENAAQRSYGFLRIVAERAPKSFAYRLRIKPIANPDQVVPDPYDESTVGQGWKYLFYTNQFTHEEFRQRFPYARLVDFSADLLKQAGRFIDGNRVTVAEYWKAVPVKRSLVQVELPDGTILEEFLDKLPEQVKLAVAADPGRILDRDDEYEDVQICQYLTNGVELLAKDPKKKKTLWPGRYIPFVACYGKIIYRKEGGEVKKSIHSYIRLARDGQKFYNWSASTEMEEMGMSPKTPFVGYTGQFRSRSADWAVVNQVPKAYLEADPVVAGLENQVLPLPMRQPFIPQTQAYEIARESARRDIQSALGRYNASIGKQDTNAKSGVAIEKLDRQSDQGSYHFIDHYDDAIRFVGVQLEDLLPHYDDTAKEVSIRDEQDQVRRVRINDPKWVNPESKVAEHLDMTAGQHAVTISSGPSFDSQREAVADFCARLAGNEMVMSLAGDLLVKIQGQTMNLGPLIDELADRLTPPPFRKQPDEKELPPEVKQMLAGAQQEISQLKQALGELEMERRGKLIEQRTKLAVAGDDREAELAMNRANNETKLAVAELGAKVDRMALFLEERARLGLQGHEAALAAAGHGADADQAEAGRRHEAALAAAGAGHEADQADAAHGRTLEVNEQQAALAPKPTAPAE